MTMEPLNNICPIADRRYEDVPIDKVKVINSRNRDQEQFDMNVESIGGVGLMKPIRVNDKFLETTGKYELICGEGRLLAHKQLNKTHVPAEVVSCTRKEALLQSLIENIARTKPGSMDFERRASGHRMFKTCAEDKSLFRAGIKYFGNWEKALQAAGINETARQRWNEEKVIERLRMLIAKHPGEKIRRHDSNLVYAAEKRFGTLAKALQVAGLPTKQTRRRVAS